MRMIVLLLVSMTLGVGGACTTTTPPGSLGTDPHSVDPKAPKVGTTILRVARHWATCEPGPVNSVTLEVGRADGTGKALVTRTLGPGEAVDLPIAAGAWWHRVVDSAGEILEEAALEAAGGHGVLEVGVGCDPHVLRGDPLAAVVLVAAPVETGPCGSGPGMAPCAGFFEGEVRLGGVAVSLTGGVPQTMRLPRGVHRLSVRRADGSAFGDGADCDGASESVSLEGAGAVAYVNRCGVVRQVGL